MASHSSFTGTLSIAFPAIAAATSGKISTTFAVAATIISGIIAFLSAKDERDKFNVAWILLRSALDRGNDIAIKEALLRGEINYKLGIITEICP
jgi:hypothetical protein